MVEHSVLITDHVASLLQLIGHNVSVAPAEFSLVDNGGTWRPYHVVKKGRTSVFITFYDDPKLSNDYVKTAKGNWPLKFPASYVFGTNWYAFG